jgi:hypothetical protein
VVSKWRSLLFTGKSLGLSAWHFCGCPKDGGGPTGVNRNLSPISGLAKGAPGHALTIGITNHAASQAGPGELPVAPCTFLAPSPLDTKPVEARWDCVCPRDRICSFQFSGMPGSAGVLEASIFILKAGLQNRAFAASVRNKDGTTYYYTENPPEFSWSVQNITLQCKPQL